MARDGDGDGPHFAGVKHGNIALRQTVLEPGGGFARSGNVGVGDNDDAGLCEIQICITQRFCSVGNTCDDDIRAGVVGIAVEQRVLAGVAEVGKQKDANTVGFEA